MRQGARHAKIKEGWTGAALARILAKGLPAGLRSGYNARKSYQVYLGYDQSGTDVYVGITNNLAKRQSKHGRRFRISPITSGSGVTRGEARAIEQAVINRNPHYVNKANSISPRRGEWGEAWLKSNGY